MWVDCAEPVTFAESKWQPGAPNNTDDNHCAYMSLSDGLYNDDNCANSRGYVCEITRKSKCLRHDCNIQLQWVISSTVLELVSVFIGTGVSIKLALNILSNTVLEITQCG